jgi:hypothetical protein
MNRNVHVCLGIYWPGCGRSILVGTNSDFSVWEWEQKADHASQTIPVHRRALEGTPYYKLLKTEVLARTDVQCLLLYATDGYI